ncbi:MAG: amidohydrolase family protein [Lachnospiraceae bacterium]|nr:amidohydrolase family protein [Lachnospiraceae bacterium]
MQKIGHIGVHHLMFGTDYPGSTPFCTYKQSIDHIVRHCDFFTDSELVLFLSENAEYLWFR